MSDITNMATTLGRETATKVRDFAATNEAAKKAKDALYTLVGLGVIGAQKINVAAKAARHKVDETVDTDGLNAAMKSSTADITAVVKRTAATVDAKVNEVIAMAEAIVTPYEEKLPAPAREMAAKVRTLSTVARAKVTEALKDEVMTDAPAAEAPVAEAQTESTPA